MHWERSSFKHNCIGTKKYKHNRQQNSAELCLTCYKTLVLYSLLMTITVYVKCYISLFMLTLLENDRGGVMQPLTKCKVAIYNPLWKDRAAKQIWEVRLELFIFTA